MIEHPYSPQPQHQPQAGGALVAQPPYAVRPVVSDAHLILAWVAAVLTLGYMLPWAIAATRRKSNSGAIGLVDLLTGWTLVGWFVSLVMACGSEAAVAAPLQINVMNVANAGNTGGAAPGWYPAGPNGGPQYWDGSRWSSHTAQ